jgi:hypothetical protein
LADPVDGQIAGTDAALPDRREAAAPVSVTRRVARENDRSVGSPSVADAEEAEMEVPGTGLIPVCCQTCHSEERSDEESGRGKAQINQPPPRSLATLGMTPWLYDRWQIGMKEAFVEASASASQSASSAVQRLRCGRINA